MTCEADSINKYYYKEFIKILSVAVPGYGHFLNTLMKNEISSACELLMFLRKIFGDELILALLKIAMNRNAEAYKYLINCIEEQNSSYMQ